MTQSILSFFKSAAIATVFFAAFTSCNDSDKNSDTSAAPPKPGFNKRGDIEVGEDGLTRLRGESDPYSGQIVQRNKLWQIGYMASYRDGKMHGPEIRYYGDGITLMRWYDWMNGEKVRHRDFYENGQIKLDAMMKNGEAFGKHRRWDDNGLLRFDGGFTDNLQWHGRVRDVTAENKVLWDAIFEKGQYISGVFPDDHKQDLIDRGLIDPETLQPIPKKDRK